MSDERRVVGRTDVVGCECGEDEFEAVWGPDDEPIAACEPGPAVARSERRRLRAEDAVAAYARKSWKLARLGAWDRFEATIRFGWRWATDPEDETSAMRYG